MYFVGQYSSYGVCHCICYHNVLFPLCSVWMQTATVSNGVLVAKVMEGSTLSYYGMSLVADSSDYLFQFSYLPVGVSTQQSVQVSFSQTQLPMATWHSLCVVVGGGTVRFYTNGVSRGSRYSTSLSLSLSSCYHCSSSCACTGALAQLNLPMDQVS